jgi:hypothetical protein
VVAPAKPAEAIFTFNVWPLDPPAFKAEDKVIKLDRTGDKMPEITVEAGSTFYVWTEEKPDGFVWKKPEHKFACATVVNDNWGKFNTGHSVWEFKAGDKVCEETVPMHKNDMFATADKKAFPIKLTVKRVQCKEVCTSVQRFESDISCQCIDIKTEEAVGRLFQAHDVKVGETTRVVLKMGEDDKVTFRDYATHVKNVDGPSGFKFAVDTTNMKFECVQPIGPPLKE